MATEFPLGLKKAATLCLIHNEQGFLLIKRNKEPHLGKYIPIGGKIEPFETPMAAALREVKEETGIELNSVHLLGIMTETSPTKFNWINYIYLADFPKNLPLTSVVPDLQEGVLEWIPKNCVTDIPTPTTDRFIYSYAAEGSFFVFDAIYDDKISLLKLVNEITGELIYESE